MFGRPKDKLKVPVYSVCGYPQEFIEALGELQLQSHDTPGALILLSVDNLAMIMSGYSMAVAEAVMGELHHVILSKAPGSKVLRVQRDQFGILMPVVSERGVTQWCHEITDAIRNYSYASRYGELHCVTSTAHVVLNGQATDVEELLGRAIVMVYENDDEVLADDISGAESREEMGLANVLGQAVRDKRVRLAYQPIIEAKTGNISHYEALLRLFSDDGKISSAGLMVPIAERMGFAPTIDKLVLEQVIAELNHANDVSIAVNVSNMTTLDPGWLDMLKAAVAKNPALAPRLTVEITETAAHHNIRHAAYFCAEVQSLGCQIALDDFGSGYTSFRQLKTLSVDMVKIDGAFIKDLGDNADSRFFVSTLLDFTRGFGLKSVAECVENGEVAKMLMELGVDMLQGYYFGRPMNHRKWLHEGEYGN